jgi:hypothetical protein
MSRKRGSDKPKTLPRQAHLGKRGMNLVERIVLEMGSTLTPTGSTEVGIDGYIELFDPHSGAPLGTVVAVQSKMLTTFRNETDLSFDYWCDRRDIDYWMRGNTPVILVVSRPTTNEAYWISVKDYFAVPENASSTRVHFLKDKHSFTKDSLHDLLNLGRPIRAGLYLPPIPRKERLHSNLLHLEATPPKIYVGVTELRRPLAVWEGLRTSSSPADGAWVLHDKKLFSFHDLSEPPWSEVCDPGTVDGIDATEWSASADLDRQHLFVQLLNRALAAQLDGVARYWPQEDCFAYVGTLERGTTRVPYRSLKKRSSIAAVTRFSTKSEDRTFVHLRHMAFRCQFRRFEGKWYLELTPTYRFTSDGLRIDRFHEDRLKTIKRIEGNRAVLSAILFWAHTLRGERHLFDQDQPARPLRFGDLLTFPILTGIDDARWSARGKVSDQSAAAETMPFLPDLEGDQE